MTDLTTPKRDYHYKTGVAAIGFKSEREIPRMFDPFIGHVDTMIYGAGKFDFNPDKDENYTADVEFAEKRYRDKVEFIGYVHNGKQVDKRQKYLDLAGKAKVDFLICIDTDDYIMPKYSDWDKFYYNLFTISEIVPDRIFYKWVWIPDEKLWPRQGNEFKSETWRKSVRIHKDPGSMRYCLDSHFMWADKNVSDQELIRWQLNNRDEPNPHQFLAVNTIDGVRDTMDRTLRSEEYNKNQAEWATMNNHAEQSEQYYKIAQEIKTPPPEGYTWEEWAKKPHTFDKKTGQRIEL